MGAKRQYLPDMDLTSHLQLIGIDWQHLCKGAVPYWLVHAITIPLYNNVSSHDVEDIVGAKISVNSPPDCFKFVFDNDQD